MEIHISILIFELLGLTNPNEVIDWCLLRTTAPIKTCDAATSWPRGLRQKWQDAAKTQKMQVASAVHRSPARPPVSSRGSRHSHLRRQF